MKGLKLGLVIMAAAILTIGLGGMAYAFHDGGVAYCEGCHTMHNSLGGQRMYRAAAQSSGPQGVVGTTNQYLLQGTDQSSTCLMCHSGPTLSSYHVMTWPAPAAGVGPANYTPGGDFAWLLKTYTWPRGTSPGQIKGHNVVAADFGLVADTRFPIGAPGAGSSAAYPTGSLGCQSCHDPHGRYRIIDANGTVALPAIGSSVLPIDGSGSTGAMPGTDYAVGVYRLLGGKGYYPKSVGATYAFSSAYDPPIAVSPSSYNRMETSNDTRVAYGSGMSQWCSNCHGGFHNETYPTTLRHPSGQKLTTDVIANYNAYKKSGDLTGDVNSSYTSLVPFEEGTTDRTLLTSHAVIDGSKKGGADTKSVVMCLTCHRAHASSWDSSTRWNVKATFLTEGGIYPTIADSPNEAQGRTDAEITAGMYGRPATVFATFQRSLCNKCHAKD